MNTTNKFDQEYTVVGTPKDGKVYIPSRFLSQWKWYSEEKVKKIAIIKKEMEKMGRKYDPIVYPSKKEVDKWKRENGLD